MEIPVLRARLIPLGACLLALLAGCDAPPPPSQVVSVVGSRVAVAPRPADPVAGSIYDALMVDDGIARAVRLATELKALGPDALPAVREAYRSVLVDLGDPELVLFGAWWAGFDPQAAWNWTRDDWRAHNPEIIKTVVAVWARQDPEAALDAALRRPAGAGLRTKLLGAMLLAWDETGEPGLLEFLRTAPKATDVEGVLARLIARRQRAAGPDAAAAWAATISDGRPELAAIHATVIEAWLEDLAASDIAAAARVAEQYGQEGFCAECYRAVAVNMGQQKGAPALEWTSTLPTGRRRDVAVQAAFRGWQSIDSIGAIDWMPEKPEAWLEPAYALAASSLGPKDPAAALAMADKVDAQHWREEAWYRIGQRWLELDETAARAWMEEVGLREELVARIEFAHQKRMQIKRRSMEQQARRKARQEMREAQAAGKAGEGAEQ